MKQPKTLKELIDYIENNMREAYASHMDANLILNDGVDLHELLKNLKEEHAYNEFARGEAI